MAVVEQRNKMVLGDEIEILGPDCDFFTQTLDVLQDEDEQPIAFGAASSADTKDKNRYTGG